MDKLKIKYKEGIFQFIINENNWCLLSFKSKEKDIFLGAEEVHRLCSKVINKLSEIHNNTPFIFNGKEMYSILNLFETHNTLLYYIVNSETIQLFLGDAHGTLSPLVLFTSKERFHFIESIKSFILKYDIKYGINE